jgi:hypothetical protein
MSLKVATRDRRSNALQRGLFASAVALMLAFGGCSVEEAPSSSSEQSSAQPAKVKHRKVRESKAIPFATEVIKTSDLAKGEKRVQQEGRRGVRVSIVRLTTKLGKVVDRDVLRKFVSREPETRVLLVGTKVEPEPSTGGNCDPNYAGACVPVASDVDCAGGSGDGPEYVEGPVQVVGDDHYDLNRDDDDVACDT